MEKIRELYVSDDYTLVRYLQKRIRCSCLDAKYEEVKGIKKIGWCCNPDCKIPDRVTERSTMLYCTKCRSINYCSRECQKAHWPPHKEQCEKVKREKKEYKNHDLMKRKQMEIG